MPFASDLRPARLLLHALIPGALTALILLAACEPAPPAQPEPVAVVSASPAPAASPAASAAPAPTPLPAPVHSQTPAAFKRVAVWTGTLSLRVTHSHSATAYSLQESYSASGRLRLQDQSGNEGGLLVWPLPSQTGNWQTNVSARSELSDSQNPAAAIQRSCSFAGTADMDASLRISGGRYRLSGVLSAVEARCNDGSTQVLPALALSDNRRFWDFSDNLPATGTTLAGTRELPLDGKLLSFSWELAPGR